ncbi:winged helix-turn-helix domain-containing protein [Rhizobium sp. No.120]
MTVLHFEGFELDIQNRKLMEDGQQLRLGGRAFDILAILAQRAGQVISKDELLDAVWPTAQVEEGTLRVSLVSLRKSLGERARGFIDNVPGKGYIFVPPVRIDRAASVTTKPSMSSADLPRLPNKVIGRDEFIETTKNFLQQSRMITITGTGGIGKTSAAIAIAERFLGRRRVLFIDLASLSENASLMPSLASQLGLSVYGSELLQAVATELRKTPTLLVFDNCEHVIEAAAEAAESILLEVPTSSILATSREPLRIQLERIRRLPPLAVPPEGIIAEEALGYAALDLFYRMAGLFKDERDLRQPQIIELSADIVRKLEGIPLAIELAASRTLDLDISELHRSVARPLAVLRRGRRNAPARQQTLQSALDWSFQTLSPAEKELLLRLSTFAGLFSAEDARAIAGDHLSDNEFYEAFDDLFLKSLLNVASEGGNYRLLVTTRHYASAKLASSPLKREAQHTHARHCSVRLKKAETDWTKLETDEWLRLHGALIHDLRIAVAWAFAPDGDVSLGIELTATSNIIWTQLGLMTEQLAVIETALARASTSEALDPRHEMHLRLSHAGTIYHIKSSERDPQALAEYHRAIQIAKELDDHMSILRASGGITAIHTMNADYIDAINVARQFDDLCGAKLPNAVSRMLAHNLHYIGDFEGAMRHANIALDMAKVGVRGTLNNGASYDQRLSALSTVVKTLWVQGELRAAMQQLETVLAEAINLDHAISTCLYLAVSACPTAFGMREFELGERLLRLLIEKAGNNSLLRWQEWAFTFEQVSMSLASDDKERFNKALANARGARFENCLIVGGHLADRVTIDRALSKNAGWCRPELYRLKGLQLLDEDADAARKLIMEGYLLSSQQGAKFWELRCATSMVRFASEESLGASKSRLDRTLCLFDGELATADLVEARALL